MQTPFAIRHELVTVSDTTIVVDVAFSRDGEKNKRHEVEEKAFRMKKKAEKQTNTAEKEDFNWSLW